MADQFSDTIPLGEWLPDKSDAGSGGATVAMNVLTDGDDYVPCASFSPYSVVLPNSDRSIGGYTHLATNGTVTVFVGSRTALYRMNSDGTWVNVSRATGGAYITPIDGAWHFWQFGDRVIATNYVDDVQTLLVNTDTLFSKLITTGPNVKARVGGIINNFNVFGDLFDDVGQSPNRIRWSPINNPAGNYTPSQATQSDYQFCEDGAPGPCMAIIGGQNYGIIVFKNALYRMEYVGPPTVFRFTLVAQNIGAINDNAVASDGANIYFRSETGFILFDGSAITPIGYGKTDNEFKTLAAPNYLYNMRSMADPRNNSVIFHFTSNNAANTSNTNDIAFIYNKNDNKFTYKVDNAAIIFRSFTQGFTLEQIGALFPNLETVPYSFDSRYWQGGQTTLAGLNTAGILGYYTGPPMMAQVESQEVRLNNNGTAYVDSVTPVFEGGAVMVRVGSRMNQNGAINYTPYLMQQPLTEEVNFTIDSRYHRIGMQLTGNWVRARGVRIKTLPSGYM